MPRLRTPVAPSPGQPSRWLLPLLFLASACTPLPPHVDATNYVPLVLAPAALTGVRDERANFRRRFCEEAEAIEHTTNVTTEVLRHNPFGNCDDGDGGVLDSLRAPGRHAWLLDHLPLDIPSYSLITAPEPDRVSQPLRSSYKLLGAVHPINDGALLQWDQILPGSTLLGFANADHWAVAVPIETEDLPLGAILFRNGYPRTRLWLSLADFVVADLQRQADIRAASE